MMPLRSVARLCLLFLLAGAATARADSVVQVTGSFSCSLWGCSVLPPANTVIESFSVTYELSETTHALVPGTMSFTSTGNLGTFVAQPITNPMFATWIDQFGNVIQLDFQEHEPFDTFPVIQFCDHCGAAFFFLDGTNPQFNDSISVQPVATPEPSALLLLVLALPLLLRASLKFK